MNIRAILTLLLLVLIVEGGSSFADCPSADLTDDFFVNFEDFAVIGNQWLNGYDWYDVNTLANQWLTGYPNIPDDMVCIPNGEFDMGDPFIEGVLDERPVHAVLIDAFFMSKYETTNQQYCDYLNDAKSLSQIKVVDGIVYASSDISNSYRYCHLHSFDADSQIDYNDVSGTFSVMTKGEPPRDMNDDPMVEVSWYAAVAYCNWKSNEQGYESCYNLSTWDCNFSKHGYRLPTEAEWEYAARGGLSGKRFPWADPNITHSQANYHASPGSFPYDANPTSGYHPDWNDGIYPYTSVVGSFAANGYGLYDMAGNVFEWCNDWYSSDYYETSPYDNPTGPTSGTYRVLRGGSWCYFARYCRVAYRNFSFYPISTVNNYGFRVVLDLN
jgi:formylglycine-generating enzyme required for sulfatase activity